MTITYTLTQEDLLNFQLFAASKNPRIRTQRSRALLINIALIIIISYFIYRHEKELYTPLITGTLLICLLPFYLRSYYKRHIRKYVETAGKSVIGVPTELSVTGEQIFSSRGGSSTQLNLAEVSTVFETSGYFVIYLRNEQGYIIPKTQLADENAFREIMIQLAARAGVNFKQELEWKWR